MDYCIITPTKNEGKFIEETIKSVISQEVLPVEWLIMDDNSSDNTEDIISTYLPDHTFIKYIKLKEFKENFKNRGGRVAAIINYADSLRSKKADLIAKIDADTSFDKNFFSNFLNEFTNDPSLGIASGHMVENGIPEKITDRSSGRGASLILRYTCYLQIGKFYESKTRGEDDMAYIAARSFGWRTNTFDFYFNHLKPIGIRNSKIKNHFETGYYKGAIPYWFPFFLGTLLRDISLKPYIIGAFVQLYGYIISNFLRKYRPFPEFVSKQIKLEQKAKFKKMFG